MLKTKTNKPSRPKVSKAELSKHASVLGKLGGRPKKEMKKIQPAYLMTDKERGQQSRKRSLENERLSNQYTVRNLMDRTTHPVLKEKQKDIHSKRTGAKDLMGISGY